MNIQRLYNIENAKVLAFCLGSGINLFKAVLLFGLSAPINSASKKIQIK